MIEHRLGLSQSLREGRLGLLDLGTSFPFWMKDEGNQNQ